MIMANLFEISTATNGEEFFSLLETSGLRLEKIVSHGQSSPAGFWYDQAGDEWVTLLQGTAQLELENQGIRELVAGDYCLIPAHCRHRVVATSADAVWLALHLQPEP